jgi:thiamine biosynthesis lipoprotein
MYAGAVLSAELQRFEAVEPHMGTLVRITLYAGSEREASCAFAAAFARVAELDDRLSDYKPGSELNGLSTTPRRVSDDLFAVLERAQRLSRETGGAFDVTLSPLTRLWRAHRLPTETELAEALRRTGWRKVHLDAGARTVRLGAGGMQLDLGGIAKGYAAGEALRVLEARGYGRALVAVSGDLALGDPPPGREGWRISAAGRTLSLRNTGVSTSGDREQRFRAAGRDYSHILDPRTGLGLTNSLEVTVIAADPAAADALATTIRVLGPVRGRALAARHHAEVHFGD